MTNNFLNKSLIYLYLLYQMMLCTTLTIQTLFPPNKYYNYFRTVYCAYHRRGVVKSLST